MPTPSRLCPPQPCAICRGATVWDPAMRSWFCGACSTAIRRVYTAPSDGREADRRARGSEILLAMAYDVAGRRRSASSVAAAGGGSEVL